MTDIFKERLQSKKSMITLNRLHAVEVLKLIDNVSKDSKITVKIMIKKHINFLGDIIDELT